MHMEVAGAEEKEGGGSSPHSAPDAIISCCGFLPEQCLPHLVRDRMKGLYSFIHTFEKNT